MSDQEIKTLLKEIRTRERSQIYDDLVDELSHEELKGLMSMLKS